MAKLSTGRQAKEQVSDQERIAPEEFCYLATTGRKTGRPHTVELWYANRPGDTTLYILSGGGERSDWVRNLLQNPGVEVRIGTRTFRGKGRVVKSPEEDLLARKLVVSKYYRRDTLNTTGWEADALPVAIDLDV